MPHPHDQPGAPGERDAVAPEDIRERPGHEAGPGRDLTEPLRLSQPTVSHHLKKLSKAGIVSGDRRGRWTYYRVLPEALADLAAVLAPATDRS